MNFLNEMKLGTRISFLTVIVTAVIFLGLISYILVTFNGNELENAYEYSEVLAKENASIVEAELKQALDSARTLSQVFKGFKDIKTSDRRDYYNSLIKNVLSSNNNYWSVWSCWEPNALDGRDDKHIDADGHDATGRYVPYYVRSMGLVRLEPLTGYDDGARSYYNEVKKKGTEIILDPYDVEVNGNKVKMTSIVVPILDNNGTFVGVTGIDISLTSLNMLPYNNGSYENSYYFLMSNNGEYVVHEDKYIGKSFSDVVSKHSKAKEVFSTINSGKTFAYKDQSTVTYKKSWFTYAPVKIGRTDTPWVFAIAIPMKEITSQATGAMLVLSLILIIVLVGIAFAIVFVVSKVVTKPIANLVEQANLLATGDTNLKIDTSSKDEIGELMRAFDVLVKNIKQQTKNAEQIAKGNLKLQIKPKSDKDVLSKSMQYVVRTLNKLVAEADTLTNAAVNGDLTIRGNEEAFKGGYKEIVAGFNKTLDKMVTPINEATIVLSQMEQGNLSARMIGEYYGDFEKIKTAVNTTGQEIQGYLAEMADVLTELSNKNLNVEITREYLGDFNRMKTAINHISDSFNVIAAELQKAAEQVENGADDVASTSRVLSEGSAEQASTVEEISATIAEVASQTKQNAENANNANEISVEAREKAEQGNYKMQDMLLAMNGIDESSNNISKIIRVIDGIAFQTKILSLNAAVEAARAGEFGKGFAVVAEEVRSLATRSANAAQETTDLIDDTIQKVQQGKSIANDTAKALAAIVDRISEASDIVEEIAEASLEQSAAIDEIGAGVIEVSKVTQANSATAEQSATASQNMSQQAQMLNDLVSQFNLKDKDIDKEQLFAEIEATKAMAEAATVEDENVDDFETIRAALLKEMEANSISSEDTEMDTIEDDDYEVKDPALADIIHRIKNELDAIESDESMVNEEDNTSEDKDKLESIQSEELEEQDSEDEPEISNDDEFDFSFLDEEDKEEEEAVNNTTNDLDIEINQAEVNELLQGVIGESLLNKNEKQNDIVEKAGKGLKDLGDKIKGLNLFGKKKE